MSRLPSPLFSTRLLEFLHLLRANSFSISASEIHSAHLISCTELLQNRRYYRTSLGAIVCRRREERILYIQLFNRFWTSEELDPEPQDSGRAQRIVEAATRAAGLAYFSESLADRENLLDASEQDADSTELAGGASDAQVLSERDFRFVFRQSEMRKIELMVDQIARRIQRRRNRRSQSSTHRGKPDLRRIAHRNVRYNGWPFSLHYRQRRRNPARFVLILDVSQSMEIYSYLFLRFIRGLVQAFSDTDAYAFHTELIHIGDELKEKSSARLEARLQNLSSGWLGGTRIAESLAAFNQKYAASTLDGNTIALIFSDGYDSGEPEDLVDQVNLIRDRVKKVVWVNPLQGRLAPNAEPVAMDRSIEAVKPLLDHYTSAHSLNTLKNLEPVFSLR